MKKSLFVLLMICVGLTNSAQNLSIKTVNLRPQDARAASLSRVDNNGKKCAIIRVGVVGVDDLVFPDAVGIVEHSLSEYIVYVSDGLKSLTYKNKFGKDLGKVVFDDFGLEINSLASYDVIFESDSHLRAAIFSIQPVETQLIVDGKSVRIDADGMGMINLPVGEYTYQVSAKGYESQSGTVSLTEDEISTITNISLQEIKYPVVINVFPEDATVFVDNIPYTKEERKDLQLPNGKHSVRVTAANYEDEEHTIDVKDGFSPIKFALKESKQELVQHKEETTKTDINIRNAFYITGGFAMMGISNISTIFNSDNAYDFTLEFSYMQHFGGIFALREGVSFSSLKPNRNEIYFDKSVYNDSTRLMSHFDVPIQIGLSFPFGKYNRHLITVLAGGYGRYLWIQDKLADSALKDEEKQTPEVEKDAEYWDYGLRLSTKADFWKFTVGADLNQSFNKMGFSIGVNIGIKLYSWKKKNKKNRRSILGLWP